jgi:trimethylamine---corrinoid protein Co-methyltransferase
MYSNYITYNRRKIIMTNTGKTQKPVIKYLTENQMEKIHDASLDILEHTGIQVDHQKGLKALEQAGCKVDLQIKRVRIPSELVNRCLKTIPAEFTLAARNPDKDCPLLTDGRPYSRNGGGSDYTIDLETGEFRPMKHADVKSYYKLMDALDGISFIAPVYGHDMPVEGRDVLVLREAFANTDKHIHLRAYSGKTLRYMFEMAAIVAGGKEALKKRPIVSLLEAPISPLIFPEVAVDGLWICGEYGIPLDICVMPISGGTGPVTIAGNHQLLNTEFLASVVISQLAHPGAPLIHAPRPMLMDMRSGVGLVASIEGAMTAVAGVQMAKYYNVPVSLHGPWTDSMTHDDQSISERMYMTLMASFSGANILAGAGMIQQGLTFSHEQLVIDDEIHKIVFRALEGFEVDLDHMAVEAIKRVGPGGNFIADDHTLKFLRDERYMPDLNYRGFREAWEETGNKSMLDRAKERVTTILKEHEPNSLPDDLNKELDDFVKGVFKSLKD